MNTKYDIYNRLFFLTFIFFRQFIHAFLLQRNKINYNYRISSNNTLFSSSKKHTIPIKPSFSWLHNLDVRWYQFSLSPTSAHTHIRLHTYCTYVYSLLRTVFFVLLSHFFRTISSRILRLLITLAAPAATGNTSVLNLNLWLYR